MDEQETATKPKLANSFRDELEAEQITPAEELHRFQVVMYAKLSAMKKLLSKDRASAEESLDILNNLIAEFKAMPDSETRELAIAGATKQFEQASSQVKTIMLSHSDEMYLATLEASLDQHAVDQEIQQGRQDAAEGEAIEDEGDDPALTPPAEDLDDDGGPKMDDDDKED